MKFFHPLKPEDHKPEDQLVLTVIVSTENPDEGWSRKFCSICAALEGSPLWVLRLPALRNPDASVQKIATGNFELRLILTESHPLTLHTFEMEKPTAALQELFMDDETLPSAVLIWIRHGTLNVVTRPKCPPAAAQEMSHSS